MRTHNSGAPAGILSMVRRYEADEGGGGSRGGQTMDT